MEHDPQRKVHYIEDVLELLGEEDAPDTYKEYFKPLDRAGAYKMLIEELLERVGHAKINPDGHGPEVKENSPKIAGDAIALIKEIEESESELSAAERLIACVLLAQKAAIALLNVFYAMENTHGGQPMRRKEFNSTVLSRVTMAD